MPRYFYRAKMGPDQIKEDIIEADTQAAAINKLNQMGYFPIWVKEETQIKQQEGILADFITRINWRDLSIFTRQLADLLGSGITLVVALDVLQKQTENRKLRAIISDLFLQIKEGSHFSDALSKYPRVFSGFYVNMVRSGEIGGGLEDVLSRLADFSEKEDELRSRVRSALTYPVLMAVVGVLTITVLLTFVIPKLVGMFEDMGQALPIPTLILIKVSGFFSKFWWIIFAIILVIFLGIKRKGFTKEGRIAIDRFKLNLPIFGPIIKKVEIARFGRTLATLLNNGVPIVKALEVVANTVENALLRRQLREMTRSVTDGARLAESIKEAEDFPVFVTNMVSVGEESGLLERALFKIAEAYERESDRAVRTMTSLLEPAMILVMGTVVGFIVISMLLPIFQINIMAR